MCGEAWPTKVGMDLHFAPSEFLCWKLSDRNLDLSPNQVWIICLIFTITRSICLFFFLPSFFPISSSGMWIFEMVTRRYLGEEKRQQMRGWNNGVESLWRIKWSPFVKPLYRWIFKGHSYLVFWCPAHKHTITHLFFHLFCNSHRSA